MKKNAKSKAKIVTEQDKTACRKAVEAGLTEQTPTLEATKALFIRTLTEWPMNAARTQRVAAKLRYTRTQTYDDYSTDELRRELSLMLTVGQKAFSDMNALELWEEAKDAFGIDGEAEWQDSDVRTNFTEWLDDKCGIFAEEGAL